MLFDKDAKGTDPDYNIYASKEGADYSIVRATLESYYSRFPTARAQELKHRFLSDFHAALFEMFLHELFLHLGCSVSVPSIISNRRAPDFDVTFPNGESVLVEATVARGASQETQASDRRQEQFYKTLRAINSPLFYVIPRIQRGDKLPASAKRMRRFIEQKLSELTQPEADAIAATGGWIGFRYEEGTFETVIHVIPKSKEGRALDSTTSIATGPGETLWGYNPHPIKDAVARKRAAYDTPGKPYVIAVNYLGSFPPDTEGIKQALYDWPNEDFPSLWRNGKAKRVSGVLLARLWPAKLHDAEAKLCLCPHPSFRCDHLPWRIPRWSFNRRQIAKTSGQTSGEILGLQSNWLS